MVTDGVEKSGQIKDKEAKADFLGNKMEGVIDLHKACRIGSLSAVE
jgi:hypothetical protein